ncbi:MAG: tRNA dihydrouridine synthase DusB [Paludibacteraceae bacterium]|nr:tRNA dihydrouridine synthase DusB [Paludibacteraceae bacterium]
MKIGDKIDLGDRPLLLAPMEDVTDGTFRLACKRYGADMVTTEFVSADALTRGVKKTERKLQIDSRERPCAIQIYGKDVETMVEAAKIAEEACPDVIDINCGCPVKKVATKGAGAGLLRDIPLMLKIVSAVVKSVKLPVTVKTRLGWNEEGKVIVELAEQLQDCGIAALTIHGRTRAQMYLGEADWTLIGEVKNNPRIKIPIVGNGDVRNKEDAERRYAETGVDGIMVGRAAVGAPWIFKEMKEGVTLTESEKAEAIINLLRDNIKEAGEMSGILHTRRHLAATPVLKGLYNFRETKIRMLRSTSEEEIVSIIREATRQEEKKD